MNQKKKEQHVSHYNVLKHCNGILIFVIFLIFFIPQKVWGNNLLVNLGFESETQSWKTNYPSVSFSIDHENFFEGTSSAQISNVKGSSYGIEQILTDISSSLSYQLSAYTKLISPYPQKALLRIAWYKSIDGSGSQLSTNDSPLASSSGDWQKLDYVVNPPETALSAKIRLLVASGSAYFDSVFFGEYFLPTPELDPTPNPTSISTSLPPTASPTPPISYDNIFISEVYPYPASGENEWLEIYNNNDYLVELTDWYLDDVENGGSSPKAFFLTINAKSYAVLDLTSSMFNNTGDSVRLLDFDKNLKDSFEYIGGEKGKSWARHSFNSDESCLQEPTKNTVNGTCINSSSSTSNQPARNASQSVAGGPPTISTLPIRRTSQPIIISTPAPTVLGEKTNISISKNSQKPLTKTLSFIAFSNSLLTMGSILLKIKLHEAIQIFS